MWDLLDKIEFRAPWLLWLGLLSILVYRLSLGSGGRVRYSSLRLLPRTEKTWRARMAWLPHALLAVAWLLFAVATAGPRTGRDSGTEKREGIAIMMVVDISGSMRALDLSDGDRERTRLEAVKEVFSDFVVGDGDLPGRPDDAIGLVSFAGYADTRCPLTLDHGVLRAVVDELEIVSSRREDGTALGDGLGLAVERLRNHPAKSKIAILLTDGVQTVGEATPGEAAELSETLGIRVYTVGAGTNGVAPVRVPDPFTGQTVLRPMPVEIDEETLEEISEHTGGKYFRAQDAEGLRQVYREIDVLERTKITEQRFREYRELYVWFVLAALWAAFLATLLSTTWLRRLP